jgi:hypothetical protein
MKSIFLNEITNKLIIKMAKLIGPGIFSLLVELCVIDTD